MRRKRTKKLFDAENRIYDVLMERYNAGESDLCWHDLAASARVRVKKAQWHATIRHEIVNRLAREGLFLKDARRNRDEDGNYLYGITQRPTEIEWSCDVKRRVVNGTNVRIAQGRDIITFNSVIENEADKRIQDLLIEMMAKNALRESAADAAVPKSVIVGLESEIRELASVSAGGPGFDLVDGE